MSNNCIEYVTKSFARKLLIENPETSRGIALYNQTVNLENHFCANVKNGDVIGVKEEDILIVDKSSYAFLFDTGERVRVKKISDQFNISVYLPGSSEKTDVYLQKIEISSLERDLEQEVVYCVNYLLDPLKFPLKKMKQALIINSKIKNEITVDAHKNPFLNPLILKYGWVSTAHKAQGTEIDSVVLYCDMFESLYRSEFTRRCSYTAITRARKKVYICEGR